MSTQKELHDAVQHVGRVTGDPAAWTRGLTQSDIAVASLVVAPEAETNAVLGKIKAAHPTLFDSRTGAPVTPPVAPAETPEPQQGAGITAIKKAEDELAHQNSSTAHVDLLVITAILNAHTTTEQGSAALRRLQAEIEDAVQVRTDLDTPAGARDFQRYLIGKLREIGAVVQTASLDDRSKAVLATAWTALYESSTAGRPGATTQPARPTASTDVPAPTPLPPYGADLGPDPLLEQLPAQEPLGAQAPTPHASSASPPATAPPVTPAGMPALPTLGGPAGGLGSPGGGLPSITPGWSRPEDGSAPPTRGEPDSLDDLLADAESVLAEEPEDLAEPEDAEPENAEAEDDEPAAPEPQPDEEPESAEVLLPGGDRITAPTPELAKVITTALAGTPVGEAFQRHGLAIPPPGTPVSDPVDPAEVSTGDVGMFTDRQALALDRTRALLGGEIQPLTSVSGPSFLGWMHPPQTPHSAPSTDVPAPTRPATTPAT